MLSDDNAVCIKRKLATPNFQLQFVYMIYILYLYKRIKDRF